MMENERQKYLQLKQQVLPFDFWEEEKKEAEEKQKQAAAMLLQAADSLPHYPEPKNDNEKLLQWQWEFKHGDQKALIKIYNLSVQICRKFINAIGQQNPHVSELTWSDKKSKAEDAATYLIERYIKIPNFAITKNYPGYLFLRVLHELYYRRKADKIQRYIDIMQCFKESADAENPELWTHYFFEECEDEEDQEQKQIKQYYLWKRKQKKENLK